MRHAAISVVTLLTGALLARAQPVPLEDENPLQKKAALLNQQVGSLLEQGKVAQAAVLAEQALALDRQLYPKDRFPQGHPDLAVSLNNQGFLLSARGELDRAETVWREALAMLQQLYPRKRFPRGHPALANSLNNLGALLHVRGELARAEPFFQDALTMNQLLYPKDRFPQGHLDLAQSLNNLGTLLHDRGELARAEPYYRAALAMKQQLYPKDRYPNGDSDLALSLTNLGALLSSRDDLDRTEPVWREALVMNQRLYPRERFPQGHPALAASLTCMADLLQRRGELARAELLLREALTMRQQLYPRESFRHGHPELAQSLNNLGHLLQVRGELAKAEALMRAAYTMYQQLYPQESFPQGHPALAMSLTNLGDLHQVRGEPATAETLLRAALVMRQSLTETLLVGSSEAQALNHLVLMPHTRDSYLSCTRNRAETDPVVYATLWQSKGTLARWLTERRLALAQAGDPQVDKLAAVRRELAGLVLVPNTVDSRPRLRELSQRKEDLEKELARRLPDFAHALEAARYRPDDLRKALPAGAAFVDLVRYVRLDQDPGKVAERRTACYLAFVLTRKGVRRVELGEAAPIDAAVAAWRRSLTGDSRDSRSEIRHASPAVRLRQLVWEPLAGQLPADTHTVWLAPDDRLTGLPWAALPGTKPGTVLLEEHALAVVPHGGVLLEGLRPGPRGARPTAAGLLAMGGVDYTPSQLVGKADLSWSELPAAAKERERVLTLAAESDLKSQALSGKNAVAAALLEALPRARWAHLATHGFFADPRLRSVLRLDEKDYEKSLRGERVGLGARNPLSLSGLVLAGGEVLTAEAIAGINLDGLELVVLSACETGLGEVAGGEGVLGLQRAFHVAGARNVIASLWKVDDEATAALMSLFYYNLWMEKLSALEALRHAQLTIYRHPERVAALARERGPDFAKVVRQPSESAGTTRASARSWAGFVLSGPGR